MQIEKRYLAKYMLLNILTLGVYGFMVSMQMGNEINEICKGDGEEPRFGYFGATMFRGIAPIIGILVGIIFTSVVESVLGRWYWMLVDGDTKAALILLSMAINGLIFSVIGSVISGLYLNYWWYKQAERLRANGYRYGLDIRETGADNFLAHTIVEVAFVPISAVIMLLAAYIPLLLIVIFVKAEAAVFASVLFFIFSLPLMFFGMELTFGSNFAKYFMFKNLNRYADAGNGNAFDPMGFENYPCTESKYPNFIPKWNEGEIGVAVVTPDSQAAVGLELDMGNTSPLSQGSLIGISGSCAGYQFELNHGEEIIIGKDAQMSSVVIDSAYKEISRKHVSISYDMTRDQYRVVDYSSNGTWAGGRRLVAGQENYYPHGTVIELANKKNSFRLG